MTHQSCPHWRFREWIVLLFLLPALWLMLSSERLQAQDATGVYTVAPGDTLSAIAARFGVTVQALVDYNGIADPNYLKVGQLLIIPGVTITPDLSRIPTITVKAQPGDSIAAVAARYAQDGELAAALNHAFATTQLFPGQPLLLPAAAASPDPLLFGAVTDVRLPTEIVQGQTGHVEVITRRPMTLTVAWNELPIPIAPQDVITRQTAFLPAPALITPGPYTVTISYVATNGKTISRNWWVSVVDGGYASQIIAVPQDRTELLAPENVQSELLRVAEVWSGVTSESMWRAPFLRPISAQYATTSEFGIRRSYDSGEYSTGGYHAGQDFGAPVGIPVTAPGAGVVALAEPLSVRGNAVLLDHGRGVYSGFWHLSEISVTPGQRVEAGDVLGLVGNTGLSTGAHLHWELRIYGIAVDPMQFLAEPLFP
jgi:murein DD-endopeptidase MepM/ murein hydrolase activator NlpD